jgi:nucleoside-diphosphate-sugar epimerase
MPDALQRLLILGCGYLGHAVAARARAQGLSVVATTRSAARATELTAAGIEPIVVSELRAELLAAHVDSGTAVVATFPPDGKSDALVAPLARHAFAAVYVSSTGVFGDSAGAIDDSTPPVPDSPRTALRLEAERTWRAEGATALRASAIYGPGRGMHERVRDGSARIAGDGKHHICRIHVDDLALAVMRSIECKLGPEAYIIADDEPAAQGDVVRYLAQLLGVPEPASVPLESVSETLRHDRRLDGARFKAHAGIQWRYPNYRVGFAACLAPPA